MDGSGDLDAPSEDPFFTVQQLPLASSIAGASKKFQKLWISPEPTQKPAEPEHTAKADRCTSEVGCEVRNKRR